MEKSKDSDISLHVPLGMLFFPYEYNQSFPLSPVTSTFNSFLIQLKIYQHTDKYQIRNYDLFLQRNKAKNLIKTTQVFYKYLQ